MCARACVCVYVRVRVLDGKADGGIRKLNAAAVVICGRVSINAIFPADRLGLRKYTNIDDFVISIYYSPASAVAENRKTDRSYVYARVRARADGRGGERENDAASAPSWWW